MLISLPRRAYCSSSVRLSKSLPLRDNCCAWRKQPSGNKLSSDSAVRDFPEPDSPTKASISPALMWKLTLETVATVWFENCRESSLTFSNVIANTSLDQKRLVPQFSNQT